MSLRVHEEGAPGVQPERRGWHGGLDGTVEDPCQRHALGAAADEHDDLARLEDRPDAEGDGAVADRALEDLVGQDVAHGLGGEIHGSGAGVEVATGLVRGDVRVRPEPQHDKVEATGALDRLLVLVAHRGEVGRADVERAAALGRHTRPGEELAPHLAPEVPVRGRGRAELVDREDAYSPTVDGFARLPVAQVPVHAPRRAPRGHRHREVRPGGDALAEQGRRALGELGPVAEDDDLHPQVETTLSAAATFSAKIFGVTNCAFMDLRSCSVTPRATEQRPQTQTGTRCSTTLRIISASGGMPTGSTALAISCLTR